MAGDMRLRRILLPAMAALSLFVSGCRAESDGKGGAMTQKITCEAVAGIDSRHLDGLCAALRTKVPAEAAPMHLVLLVADRAGMKARLDQISGTTTRTGKELSFDVMDRELNERDYETFAATLLRFGQE